MPSPIPLAFQGQATGWKLWLLLGVVLAGGLAVVADMWYFAPRRHRAWLEADIRNRGWDTTSIRQKFFWLALTQTFTRRWSVRLVDAKGQLHEGVAQTHDGEVRWLSGPLA